MHNMSFVRQVSFREIEMIASIWPNNPLEYLITSQRFDRNIKNIFLNVEQAFLHRVAEVLFLDYVCGIISFFYVAVETLNIISQCPIPI